MTEREAKGLAAELDSHRYWRVRAVALGGMPIPLMDWQVVLEHRTVSRREFIILAMPSDPQHLADILMADGADPYAWANDAEMDA